MATGTEDYYDSAYYFDNAYPLHLDNSGFTWNENIKGKWGPFNGNFLKWSAYRMHWIDAVFFNGGGKFVWRVGGLQLIFFLAI